MYDVSKNVQDLYTPNLTLYHVVDASTMIFIYK